MKFYILFGALLFSNYSFSGIYLQSYEAPRTIKYGVNTIVFMEPKKDACSQKMCVVVTPKWNSVEPKKLQLRSHITQLHVNIRSASILIDGQEIILNTGNGTILSENLDGTNKLSMQNHYANFDIIERIMNAQDVILKIRTANGETESKIKSKGSLSIQGEVFEAFKTTVNTEKQKLGIK